MVSFRKTLNIKRLVVTGGSIGAATILANMITYSHMGALHNGLQSNDDLTNDAESGGNLAAGDIEQQQFYGRPLNDQEVAVDQIATTRYIAELHKQESPYQRYLAISNADSLHNHMAVMTMGYANRSALSSLISLGSRLFSPIDSLGTIVNSLTTRSALAAASSTSASTNYGNVQWGYSAEEMALLKDDPSYMQLENQKILDDSQLEGKINDEYHQCFDGSKQVGDMLASGDIQRDDSGNVTNDGLCSPQNLGSHNTPYGDLVFRWRVAHSYDNTLSNLEEAQDPSSGNEATSSPNGTAFVAGDTSNLTCQAGSDGGIGDGYKEGRLFKIRLCEVQGTLVNAQIATKPDAFS